MKNKELIKELIPKKVDLIFGNAGKGIVPLCSRQAIVNTINKALADQKKEYEEQLDKVYAKGQVDCRYSLLGQVKEIIKTYSLNEDTEYLIFEGLDKIKGYE